MYESILKGIILYNRYYWSIHYTVFNLVTLALFFFYIINSLPAISYINNTNNFPFGLLSGVVVTAMTDKFLNNNSSPTWIFKKTFYDLCSIIKIKNYFYIYLKSMLGFCILRVLDNFWKLCAFLPQIHYLPTYFRLWVLQLQNNDYWKKWISNLWTFFKLPAKLPFALYM